MLTCLLILSLPGPVFSEIITFDDIVIPDGQSQLFFLDEVLHGVRFYSTDPYDPDTQAYGWICVNKRNYATLGVSSLENSIFSGYKAAGKIRAEFPELVNFVQITGGDAGNDPDSFTIEAYDSEDNLLVSADTGFFSGNPGNPPGEGYYVDQATLSVAAPDIKYIVFYATTPITTSEGGVSFDDLVYEYQSPLPIPELTADAGEDVTIFQEALPSTIINGTATYTGYSTLEYRWRFGEMILQDWTPAGLDNSCPLGYGGTVIPVGTYVLTLEVRDGQVMASDDMVFTILPELSADAGENLTIISEALPSTIIYGSAIYSGDNELEYRWRFGQIVLQDWVPAGVNRECWLVPGNASVPVGTYVLTLDVRDGDRTVSDEMILTIDNTAPHAAPSGSGVFEINSPVSLGGNVSDFDGDLLLYRWLEGDVVLHSGTIQSIAEGYPVEIPAYATSNLGLGFHTIVLEVNDGTNQPVTSEITVEIVDMQVPTLAPVANKTILWPPNHKMVDIVIEANAGDNSGGPITLTAVVSSSEPIDGPGDGDTSPDWIAPSISQDSGIIRLQLRAERSGEGNGRVYTVTITASDTSGNSSVVDIDVIVPHDKGNK